jgi:uncharacterized membrane protein
MNRIRIFRILTLSGYFSLMTLIFGWHLWVQPLPAEFISITLLLQLGPLMFPLRGLLHGKAYTHAWASYLALFYFVVGVWYATAPATLIFGILMCICSLDFFIGTVFYARFMGQTQRHTASGN